MGGAGGGAKAMRGRAGRGGAGQGGAGLQGMESSCQRRRGEKGGKEEGKRETAARSHVLASPCLPHPPACFSPLAWPPPAPQLTMSRLEADVPLQSDTLFRLLTQTMDGGWAGGRTGGRAGTGTVGARGSQGISPDPYNPTTLGLALGSSGFACYCALPGWLAHRSRPGSQCPTLLNQNKEPGAVCCGAGPPAHPGTSALP